MRFTLRCAGCGAHWDAEHTRVERDWQVFFTAAQPPQPIAYCPGCSYARSTTRQGRRSRGSGDLRTETTR
jgi:hypothetical protein